MSSPVVNINLDYQFSVKKFSVSIYNEDTPVLKFYLYCNQEPFQPVTGQTCKLAYTTEFETNTSPTIITGTISTTENCIEFNIPSNISNGEYFAQVSLNSTDKQWVFSDGKLKIKRKMTGW